MNLTEEKLQGQNSITILDSMNSALLSIKICPQEGVVAPDGNQLVISVGDKYAILGSQKAEIKNYVYNLSRPLCYSDTDYGEFHQEVEVVNNEYVVRAYIEWSNDDGTTIEELEPLDIILFRNSNIISTNYENVDIELIYQKYNEFNKYFVNTLAYEKYKKLNKSLTLEDLYFKDSFTKTRDEINEDIDNLNVKCITSKNNKFSLDSDGNLTVNSITMNSSSDVNFDNNKIRDFIYPVGSIYMSINNIEPSSLFGGKWEKLEDRFLLGSGTLYANGNIGGEATHVLSESEMPRHRHTLIFHSHDGSGNSGSGIPFTGNGKSIVGGDISGCQYAGSNSPHNNMPPYLVVNMWKRVE